MKTIILSLVIAVSLYATALASSRVKKVEVQKDQIVRVNTAVGIATIIQVPDRPNSVVVGDQDAFKVEYLDLAITIKPITPHGKSNLYIYTDYRRFNVELNSGPEIVLMGLSDECFWFRAYFVVEHAERLSLDSPPMEQNRFFVTTRTSK